MIKASLSRLVGKNTLHVHTPPIYRVPWLKIGFHMDHVTFYREGAIGTTLGNVMGFFCCIVNR